jgi:hypothetical protein
MCFATITSVNPELTSSPITIIVDIVAELSCLFLLHSKCVLFFSSSSFCFLFFKFLFGFGLFTIDLLTATSGFRRELGKTLFFFFFFFSSSSCCRHQSTKGVVTTIGTLTKSKQENTEHAVGVVVGFCDKEREGAAVTIDRQTDTDRRDTDCVPRSINCLALHLTVHVCVCLCFINV